jgi:hypothetical protein
MENTGAIGADMIQQRRPIMADKQVEAPQHPNPFCNFWNGPIGGPGCICTGNVSGISATSQTIYSCRHGASSQPCQICKGVAEFDAQFDPLRRQIEQLEEALMWMLRTDGHTFSCKFAGCTCGSVDEYKACRANAVELLRALSSTATEKTEAENG